MKHNILKDKYNKDSDFMAVANPILDTPIVKSMEKYRHHGHVNCFEHSVDVAFVAYRLGGIFKLDRKF